MHRYINKKIFIAITIILFIIEIILIYLIIKAILTEDLVSPAPLNFYDYIKYKIQNII